MGAVAHENRAPDPAFSRVGVKQQRLCRAHGTALLRLPGPAPTAWTWRDFREAGALLIHVGKSSWVPNTLRGGWRGLRGGQCHRRPCSEGSVHPWGQPPCGHRALHAPGGWGHSVLTAAPCRGSGPDIGDLWHPCFPSLLCALCCKPPLPSPGCGCVSSMPVHCPSPSPRKAPRVWQLLTAEEAMRERQKILVGCRGRRGKHCSLSPEVTGLGEWKGSSSRAVRRQRSQLHGAGLARDKREPDAVCLQKKNRANLEMQNPHRVMNRRTPLGRGSP